jgi:hypothetical protein
MLCSQRRGSIQARTAVHESRADRLPDWNIPFRHRASFRGIPIRSARAGLHGEENVLIEYRSAEGNSERLSDLAAELIRLRVDVIVTTGASVTRSARKHQIRFGPRSSRSR